MKLTKDDFEQYGQRMRIKETWFKMSEVEEILKNQEDAEKYQKFIESHSIEVLKCLDTYHEIVERLKKLIEDKKWYGRDATVEELQKTLGESDE